MTVLTLARRKRLKNVFVEDAALQILFLLSWMVSLFPVSGILTVGTFIADRMVIPFTFAVCVLGGKLLSDWILLLSLSNSRNSNSRNSNLINFVRVTAKTALIALSLIFLTTRIFHRSEQWMSSFTLFDSSLEACPRFAKSRLQLSKIYSGTIPGYKDLEKSLEYARMAEEIDPDFCRVHFQFAIIYYEQNDYPNFEQRLAKALACPFTSEKAYPFWTKYWNVVLDADASSVVRKRNYEENIQIELAKQSAIETEQESLIVETARNSEL